MVVLSGGYYYYYHHHHYHFVLLFLLFLPGASIRYACIILAVRFDGAAARMGMLVGCKTDSWIV